MLRKAFTWLFGGLAFYLVGSGLAAAQKAPGTYKACEIDSPPAGCDDMYVVIVTGLADRTGVPVSIALPPCGAGEDKGFYEQALDIIRNNPRAVADMNLLSGDLFLLIQNKAMQEAAKRTGGDLHDFFVRNGPRRQTGNCAPLAAILPSGATLKGARVYNHDIDAAPGQHWFRCPAGTGEECPNGYARFISPPDEKSVAGRTVVSTIFENHSHDRRRAGHLYVFYTMPPGRKPVPII